MHNQLKAFIEQYGISQTQVAKAVDLSGATLSLYLNGRYTGNKDAIDKRVSAYLRQQQQKAKIPHLEIPFVATRTARKALAFLELCHGLNRLGIMYGGAGLGKTTVLREFVKFNPSTVLIEPDMGFSAKVLLQAICRTLGVDVSGNIHDLTERIIGVLRGSGRLLVIDEAELLPLRALECVRRIRDKADCAVVLVGMPKLLLNLKGQNAELKQLFSRVAMKHEFGDAVSDEDITMIAKAVLGEIDDELLPHLCEKVSGNIRKLCNVMTLMTYLRSRFERDSWDLEMLETANDYLIH